MKILNSQEFINEKLDIHPITKEQLKKYTDEKPKPKSYYTNYIGCVFAFKNISQEDRDAVSYVKIENGNLLTDIDGQIMLQGANFTNRLDKNAEYNDYETVLSEEQFNAFKLNSCPQEMLDSIVITLLSDKNSRLIEKVKKDELGIISRNCGISLKEAKDVVDDYPSNNEYFDHGICTSWKDINELIENMIFEFSGQSWLVTYLKNNYNGENEEMDEYFEVAEETNELSYETLVNLGYDFSQLDAKELNDNYVTLDNGVIIEYYL